MAESLVPDGAVAGAFAGVKLFAGREGASGAQRVA